MTRLSCARIMARLASVHQLFQIGKACVQHNKPACLGMYQRRKGKKKRYIHACGFFSSPLTNYSTSRAAAVKYTKYCCWRSPVQSVLVGTVCLPVTHLAPSLSLGLCVCACVSILELVSRSGITPQPVITVELKCLHTLFSERVR